MQGDFTDQDSYLRALLDGIPLGFLEQAEELNANDHIRNALELLSFQPAQEELEPLMALSAKVWQGEENYFFKPHRLDWSEDTFYPTKTKPSADSVNFGGLVEELEELYNSYAGETDRVAFRYSMYHCLQAWGSRIRLSGQDDPFISLFDRNRLLAATVKCLSQVEENKPAKFILLKGGVSGIQRFIYDNIKAEQIGEAKKVAKRLRGRSFFVSHLCQVIAEYVVEELNLEQANILFVGGGHFNLLLPNTDQVINIVAKLKNELNVGLLEHVGFQLSVNIAFEKVSSLSDVGKAFQELGEKFVHAKQRRYLGMLETMMENGNMHSRDIKEIEEVGKIAPYASFILEIKGEEIHLNELSKQQEPSLNCLRFLNRTFYLFTDESQLVAFYAAHCSLLDKCGLERNIIRINDTRLLTEGQAVDPLAGLGFQYIGRHAPRAKEEDEDSGFLMMFEDMAGMYGQELPAGKYQQLAVMRLDVDDLGTLFGYGLGVQPSIARIATLSREMHLFFGGYFNKIAEQHQIYVTYSGGDDAFVVGSWWNMIQFAEALHSSFQQFTCYNPHITFSAGIFSCHPHYPVARFAKEGEEQEKEAKKHMPKDADGKASKKEAKNAIRLFNRTLSWSRFDEMMDYARSLEEITAVERSSQNVDPAEASRKLRRSMLQRFLAIIQSSQKDTGDFTFFRNIGRMHGLLARHGYNKKALEKNKKAAAGKLIEQLLKEVDGPPDAFYDYTVPLQYVLYTTRTMNK